MTRVSILDSSTVTINGVEASMDVTGPVCLDCVSVSAGGVTLTGCVVVSSSGAFQSMQLHPSYMAIFPYGLFFASVLGLLVSRFRL